MYYNDFVFVFVFVWRPCMVINVSVQHNGGFISGIISGTLFNAINVFFVFAAYDPT